MRVPAEQRKARQKGAAMVEAGYVLPVYFMLVFGLIQFFIIFFGYINMTYASRQAGRYAATHGTGATYTCTAADVQGVAQQFLWGVTPTVTTTWSPNNNPGSSVTVSLSAAYPAVIPFVKAFTVTLGAATTLTILQ